MKSGIETVLEVLERAGFERLSRPLIVAGSTFDFDAAARGTGVSHDLVVVAAGPADSRRLVRLLSGLSRTLDQLSSRRPVSLVLLGADLDGSALADLERLARVLVITNGDPEPDEVERAVAVLTPLTIPSGARRGRDPLAEVAAVLGPSLTPEHQTLMNAARFGPDEVRRSLLRLIDDAATGASTTEPRS